MSDRQAIITEDKKIKCPICGKTAGIVNEGAVITNYIILCRGSRRNHRHYFVVNWNGKQKGDIEND